ncbi:MAG: proline racemase family protein [Gammaproteobacteria bacterium]|jgi:proline racemase|nr:proline racemase family protein [Gammaproteobacteria bacterium]
MRWTRTIQSIDVHCAGEIGRVITGGVLDIPGASMAEKLAYINEVDDDLRRFLCSEPRSGPAGSFVLLLPATDSQADTGFIVLQPDQAHAMSGSNAICAVTAILETGMKPMLEPTTEVVLDTAAGLVRAVAHCQGGKVSNVTLTMPTAFVAQQGVTIETQKWGSITYDLCFGGVFYALVDAQQLHLEITPESARELAIAGVELRDLIASSTDICHPLTPAVNGIAYVMWRSNEPDGAVKTCTTMRPGRIDRSPCGTGSTANMAASYAKGMLQVGESMVSRSTIGSEFVSRLVGLEQVGPYTGVQVTISGQAWIYGMSQLGLDPADPFPQGFIVADTWGQVPNV